MTDTHVTITGNLTDDPELKFHPQRPRRGQLPGSRHRPIKDGDTWKDGDTSFFRVDVWRQLAEHVSDSLSKGGRAVVIGRPAPLPQLGDPRGRQALGGRSRGRRGRPVLALGDR